MGAIRKIAIGFFVIPHPTQVVLQLESCEWAALELAECDCAFNCITGSHELLLRVFSKPHSSTTAGGHHHQPAHVDTHPPIIHFCLPYPKLLCQASTQQPIG